MDLVTPLVNDKESLSAKVIPTLEEDEVLLHVYASADDVARLIGRRGMMASSIRQMMSIAARKEGKIINVRFESY